MGRRRPRSQYCTVGPCLARDARFVDDGSPIAFVSSFLIFGVSSSNHSAADCWVSHAIMQPLPRVGGLAPSLTPLTRLSSRFAIRDDIKSVRLACKEFEHYIFCILFRTVVVPFNTEIYGMLTGLANARVDAKGLAFCCVSSAPAR